MLAVFRRPDDERAYVKRLVGLPGDRLLIRNGDLFDRGVLLVKPDRVQDEVLVRVYDEHAPFPRFDSFWCVTSGRHKTTSDGMWLESESSGAVAIQTRDEITDGHLDGEGHLVPGREVVDDLEIRVRFVLGAEIRAFGVGLESGWDRIRVAVGAAGKPGRVTLPGGVGTDVPGLRVTPGREHVLTVTHVDRRLRVRLDGVTHVRRDGVAPHAGRPSPPRRNRLEIFGSGDRLRVTGLRVRRDLHFIRDGEHANTRPTPVGPGCYFLLGDNSGESVDSRHWGAIPGRGLIGEPVLIFWPIRRLRLL
jgi:hypothetical protein